MSGGAGGRAVKEDPAVMFNHRTGLISIALIGIICLSTAAPASALEECRLLRQPDIHGDNIVFIYGGDLWKVARGGGVAARLTTHEGVERFPKFSPDGEAIAFTAEYDGNVDAFSMPAEGGEPRRLTWHPSTDQVAEWYPDGESILLRSPRAAATRGVDRFFKIPAGGGFEEMLALPTGGYASFAAGGGRIAFVSPSYDNRTWKRYKGGNAPEIWVYDFEQNSSEKITEWAGADEWPMWHGETIYYAGDTGYGGGDHYRATRQKFGDFRLALLPIGAYAPRWFMKASHMNPEEAVMAHQDLGATHSLAIHFATFQQTFKLPDLPGE